MCGFLGSWAAALSGVVYGFVLFAGRAAPFLPWLFLFHIFLVCLLSAVEAKGQLRDGQGGAGRPKEGAFPQRLVLILFLQVKSQSQYSILAWDGHGFSLPVNSGLKCDLFLVYKAKTPYIDLYSLQVMHTREGYSPNETRH